MCIENRLLLCAYAKKPFYKGLCRRSSNSIHKNIPFGGSASGCVVFCCMSFGLSSEHRDLHKSNFACSITQSGLKCKYLRAFDGGFDFFQQIPDRQMLRTVCPPARSRISKTMWKSKRKPTRSSKLSSAFILYDIPRQTLSVRLSLPQGLLLYPQKYWLRRNGHGSTSHDPAFH